MILLFLGIIVGIGTIGREAPPGFPPVETIRELVRARQPHLFLDDLAETMGAPELDGHDLRALLRRFDEIGGEASAAELTTIEGIRGVMLRRYGHPGRAFDVLWRAFRGSEDRDEREALLEQLFQAARASRQEQEFLRVTSDTALLLEFGQTLNDFRALSATAAPPLPEKRRGKMLLAWVMLLILPWFIAEWRVYRWRQRFPGPAERQGPFFAFMRSSIGVVTSIVSAVLVLAFNLPTALGFEAAAGPALAHLLVVYLSTLRPLHRLDREVRGATWGFLAYARAVIGMAMVNAALLVVPIGAALILRAMTANLPLWPITWPLGVGLGFPALCGALLLLYPLLVPWILWMRRLPADQRPPGAAGLEVPLYRWDLSGSKIYNALAFGYLSPTQAIAISSPLLEEFPEPSLRAILEHEKAHLAQGHLFVYFLLMLAGAMVGGVYAVVWPLEVQRLLMMGPGFWQIGGFFLVLMGLLAVFRRLAWEHETAADAQAATAVGREAYLQALTELTCANYLPERVREGEEAQGIHPPLQERKRRLRAADGECFLPTHPPSTVTLVALWRSRLAVDWKSGQTEAEHLCALDYHLTSPEPAGRWRELAARHAAFGSECLVRRDGRGLEVLACAQKSCARQADPPLPADRICLLCSAGQREALGDPRLTWTGTPTGCRLLTS
ncbi:MAG: hypothetical protein OZSIB_2661 [Candidatus Ozemobacter sibiricus]|uniref:Peptidase M48 domain-containing protein n=1 Tax=Candidatus Ozemobacter sibiricus TaxID=2268124 RepID=A0A367ZRM7_9BACT|nr:MAG: hypothetical protein OZSIB_2661 [Candidatus Ozemobacter sibiricus]